MTHGSYIAAEGTYYSNRFQEAEARLREYPELRSVFGSVSWPEDSKLRTNPLLLELSREQRPGKAVAMVSTIETALAEVTSQLPVSERNDLYSELQMSDQRKVLSRVLELLCYQYLRDEAEVAVTPEPSVTGSGETDLLVDDAVPVYVEVTRLGTPKTEREVEAVYESVAEQLYADLPPERYLRLNIDSSELNWTGTPLDCDGSEAKILDQVRRMELLKLLQFTDMVPVQELQGMPDKWTLREVIQHTANSSEAVGVTEEWQVLLGQSACRSVLQTKISAFDGPVTAAFAGDATDGLVELYSDRQWPSDAAENQEDRLLSRIERRVEKKIRKGQREPGAVNVLCVGRSHWLSRGYTKSERDPLGVEQRSKIMTRVQETLARHSVPELVGVVLVEDAPSRSLWVANPGAASELADAFEETAVAQVLG